MQTESSTTANSNGSPTAVGSSANMDIATVIDHQNKEFIDNAKDQLQNLDRFTTEALEWLMAEHYQFSFQNTKFLAAAAEATGAFDTDAVKKELIRNCEEEDDHAVMYKAALKKVGVDVNTREEFPSTSLFLNTIGELVDREPSAVLGTMFATETAAIFEHEVFLDISKEIIARRNVTDQGPDLIYFHEMHLSGVEQSHRDELGIFLRGLKPDEPVAHKEGDRPTIYSQPALAGAAQAIAAMTAWWADLLSELSVIGKNQTIA